MQETTSNEAWNCRIDTSGRIVLPQPVRSTKQLNNGDELILTIENGAIVLRSYEDAMQQLQDAYSQGIAPDRRLAEELITERRAEAARETRR